MNPSPLSFLFFLKKYDPNWLLFLMNAMLVIIGYWAANLNITYFIVIRNIRMVVLLASLMFLILQQRKHARQLIQRNDFIVGILILLLIPSVLYSSRPIESALNLVSLALFLFYVWYFVRGVSQWHSEIQNQFVVITIFRICYVIPILLYFVQRPSLLATNIYGVLDLGLVSNNFGWAASFYLLLTIDRLQNFPQRKALYYLNLASVFPALYLVIISGSRSAALAITICLTIHFLRSKKRNFRIGLWIVASGVLLYAMMTGGQKLALQRKGIPVEASYIKKESRLQLWKDAYRTMRMNPSAFLRGVQSSSSSESILKHGKKFSYNHLHNTYINFLWQAGIFCFGWILTFFLVLPLATYFREDVGRYTYPLHPFIIAMFDHQMGPGQFMAFPLIYTIFLYLQMNQRVRRREITEGV